MSRRTVFSLIAFFFILSMSCFSGEVIAQNEGERTFRPLPEPVRTVDLDAMQIYRPASLTMDSNGDMALYDYGLNQLYIIYFADEGHTTTIGDGQGEGPGEFMNPIGLDFDDEGHLWVVDGNLARMTVWNKENELLENQVLDGVVPYRIAIGNDRGVITNSTLNVEGVFHLFDKKTLRPVRRFESFEEEGYTFFGEADGDITATDKYLFFTHRYNSFFKKYNWDGELVYRRNTVEKVSFPGLEILESGGFRMPMDASIATVRPASNGEYLYLLYGGEGKRIGTVIDVYEVTSGEYLYSYDVEKRASGLAAAGGLLALIQHKDGIYEILVFELNCYQEL